MKFTIQNQAMFLEIDLTSLILTINSIQTNLHHWKTLKTQASAKQIIQWLNKTLTSSVVKIKKRKFEDSLDYTYVTDTKLVEWKNWIYLNFSVIDWNKKYSYNFRLMDKISYKFKRKILFFGSYEIVIDNVSLKSEVMKRTLNNWVKKCYSVKNINWFFDFKLVWLFTLIVWSIWLYPQTLAYFGM